VTPALVILLAAALALVAYGIMLYNSLVTVKNNVSKAYANIDVLLKQRHDELPKLVETCRQYMKFEQDTLARVMEARARVSSARETQNLAAMGEAESQLRASVGNLFAVAEAYPDLKTDQTFLQLQSRITALESEIADRREFYNECVNVNNVRIEQFPERLVAQRWGFITRPLLTFETAEKADPNLRELFTA
jgi:LemA protein